MVVVVASVATAHLREVLDKLDTFDPFDQLEPKLYLVTQAKGRPMPERKVIVDHLVGQHRQGVAHLLDRLGVLVDSAVRTERERVEDHPFRLRFGSRQLEDGTH